MFKYRVLVQGEDSAMEFLDPRTPAVMRATIADEPYVILDVEGYEVVLFTRHINALTTIPDDE